MNEKIYTQENLNAAVSRAIKEMSEVLTAKEEKLDTLEHQIIGIIKDYFKTRIDEIPIGMCFFDFDIIEDLLIINKELCYKIKRCFLDD